MMAMIELNKVTKDYGHGRGIFAVDLSIEKGEVFGFVGINGAGKTTVIRHLMGFLKPDSGNASIDGKDCWSQSAEIMKKVGYIPGEIAFPDAKTGTEFLERQARLLGITDTGYRDELIQKLQLDPTANLKRMSKGMKQKTAVVAALMADPEILIMDEPTTGLDPLMRAEFLEIMEVEKRKGKTIFMSNHMFDEIEHICDKVALIQEGKIIDVKVTKEIRHNEDKQYKIEFVDVQSYERFLHGPFELAEKRPHQKQVIIKVNDSQINELFQALLGNQIRFISEIKFTLEDYFNGLIKGGK